MLRGGNESDYDQFLTKHEVSEMCISFLSKLTNINLFDIILEPSCGNGSFLRYLPSKTIYIDIDSTDENRRIDFLKTSSICDMKYEHGNKKFLTIGNPPFGKNSSLAISFFNKAAEFSDIIAFIVPKTFLKKSVENRLDHKYHLTASLNIPENSFIFKDKDYNVPCIFQIWIYYKSYHLTIHGNLNLEPRKIISLSTTCEDFDFVKVSDNPDIIIRRNGVLAGKIFKDNLEKWVTNNHYFIKVKDRNRVQEVIQKLESLNLENSEVKYATAGYPSISKAELCLMYNEK